VKGEGRLYDFWMSKMMYPLGRDIYSRLNLSLLDWKSRKERPETSCPNQLKMLLRLWMTQIFLKDYYIFSNYYDANRNI